MTAANLNGFVLAPNGDNGDTTPNGTVSFVAASDAPKGSNVLDMQTITGKNVVAYLPSAAGRLLSELTSFGYASKVIQQPQHGIRRDRTDRGLQVERHALRVRLHHGRLRAVRQRLPGHSRLAPQRRGARQGLEHPALPSGNCSQAVPCPFSTFVAENPQAYVISAPKFRIGQNSGTPAGDAGEYQVDDVIYGFGSALNYDLGA